MEDKDRGDVVHALDVPDVLELGDLHQQVPQPNEPGISVSASGAYPGLVSLKYLRYPKVRLTSFSICTRSWCCVMGGDLLRSLFLEPGSKGVWISRRSEWKRRQSG